VGEEGANLSVCKLIFREFLTFLFCFAHLLLFCSICRVLDFVVCHFDDFDE
jgi:hypothetical protein